MYRIERQWVVKINGWWQVLFQTNAKYFITTNGGLGERDTHIEEISEEEVMKIQKEIKSNTAQNKTP